MPRTPPEPGLQPPAPCAPPPARRALLAGLLPLLHALAASVPAAAADAPRSPATPAATQPAQPPQEVISNAPPPAIVTDGRGVLKKAIVLTLDAAFMRPPVAEPLAGARDTVVSVSVAEAPGAVRWLDAEDFKRFGGGLDQFLPATAALAAKLLDQTPPRYERDPDGVISFGVLESDSPLLASVIFAPGFPAVFRDTIGPLLEIVIPSRRKVFVFPPGDAQAHEQTLWREFRSAEEPVSLEVFEVSRRGIRVTGTLRP